MNSEDTERQAKLKSCSSIGATPQRRLTQVTEANEKKNNWSTQLRAQKPITVKRKAWNRGEQCGAVAENN